MKDIIDVVSLPGVYVDLCVVRNDPEAIKLYTKWMNDKEINKWIGHSGLVVQLFDWANRKWEEEESVWCIVEKSSRKLIGTCTCIKSRRESNATLGILIGEECGRDKGYGTEVIKMMVSFAFNELNVHRIELRVDSENFRARKCYEKSGFIECGRLHEATYFNGHYTDIIIMEQLKKENKLYGLGD